jgi:hypothetical protein
MAGESVKNSAQRSATKVEKTVYIPKKRHAEFFASRYATYSYPDCLELLVHSVEDIDWFITSLGVAKVTLLSDDMWKSDKPCVEFPSCVREVCVGLPNSKSPEETTRILDRKVLPTLGALCTKIIVSY